MQNRIKVIISDLDGTLLNQHHTISEYTKAVFKNYIMGYLLIATGRHHLDALPIIAGIGCPIYLVTSNGDSFSQKNFFFLSILVMKL
jgi:hydroxymethylpyrimidine pyrophosphatase-like HAD family hydrolase